MKLEKACLFASFLANRRTKAPRRRGDGVIVKVMPQSQVVKVTDLAFDPALGSHMVLQRSPASAALFGSVATDGSGGRVPDVFVQLWRMKRRSDPQVLQQELAATVTLDGRPDHWRWHALLDPVDADSASVLYEVTVSSSAGGAALASLSHVLFGDTWVCAGQSNMEVEMRMTFSRQNATAAVHAGSYLNIRLASMWRWPDPTTPRLNRWHTPRSSLSDGRSDNGASQTSTFDSFCATCWYFAQELTDWFVRAGRHPPALGLICLAAGASSIEQWSPPGQLQRKCAHTLVAPGTDSDGDLYKARVEPLTRLSIKGWLWHQGEHNLKVRAHPRWQSRI